MLHAPIQALVLSRVTIAMFLLIGLPNHSFIESSTWEHIINAFSAIARQLDEGSYSQIGAVCLLRAFDRLVRVLPRMDPSDSLLKVRFVTWTEYNRRDSLAF